MLRNKRFLLILILALALLLIPSICNAAVTYTRSFPSNDGTIKINLAGLTLSEEKQYEFSLVSKGGTPQNWNLITNYTTSTAELTLSSGTSHIISVLKIADAGQIFVREKDNTESYIVNRLDVNLKLPYLQSLVKSISGYNYNCSQPLYGDIAKRGGQGQTYTQWEKVTDRNFIEEFLEVKNNEGDVATLESHLPSCPTSGYTPESSPSYNNKNDGLYLLWVKRTGENCKDVYSCIIHDGLPEATEISEYIEGGDVEKPVVNSISVISPVSGIYSTNQIVKISVKFSENITGSTVPVLKVRFGESDERVVTNGTISGDSIVYSYNISDEDEGQLAVTSFSGGTIKDAAGNDAVISLKTLSGNTIKANIEEDNETTVELISIEITKEPTKTSYVEGEKFDKTGMVVTATYDDGTTKEVTNYTVSPLEELTIDDDIVVILYTENGETRTAEQEISVTEDSTTKGDNKLPQTGATLLSLVVIGLIAVTIVSKVKCKEYKDI